MKRGVNFDPNSKVSITSRIDGRGRINVFLLRDVFLENVVLDGAGNLLPVGALLFRHDQIHRPEHAGRRIDGHRGGDVFEADAVEENLHIFERIDGDAALADLAFAGRMIGVVAHQRGQIEGDRESAAAMFEKIFVALVGFFGRGEAGEHAHRPELAAVAGRVNAARVGRLAGIAEVLIVVPVGGKIGLRVETANRGVRDRAEAGVAVLVEVGAGGRADGFFGSLVEGGREGFLCPVFFRLGGMAALEDIGDRAFRYGFRLIWFSVCSRTLAPHFQRSSMIEERLLFLQNGVNRPRGWGKIKIKIQAKSKS